MANQLGAQIVKVRNEHGRTQGQLAEVLGVSRATFGHWETGERRPDPEQLKTLARELGLPEHYFASAFASDAFNTVGFVGVRTWGEDGAAPLKWQELRGSFSAHQERQLEAAPEPLTAEDRARQGLPFADAKRRKTPESDDK